MSELDEGPLVTVEGAEVADLDPAVAVRRDAAQKSCPAKAIRVTDPARSILDAAGAGTAPEQIVMAVRQALNEGLTTRRSLLALADRRGGRVADLVRRAVGKDGQS